MEKSPEFHYPQAVEKLDQTMENLGIKPIDAVISGSQDPKIRREGLVKISESLENESESNEKKEEEQRIDVMEQFSQFSEEEIRLMLNNMNGFQLTEGCNGKCPFCFLARKGEQRKVTEHYTFSSLETFFSKYKDKVGDIFFYWESDPFDYYDKDERGEHSFLDVYRLTRSNALVSTSIPKGSEQRFIIFIKAIADKILSHTRDESVESNGYWGPRVRISVGKNNIQRITATLKQLSNELQDSGYSATDISDLFQYGVITEERLNVHPLGPLIDKHDDISGANSFACSDGVVITPSSVSARIVVAPTIYEPAGEKSIPILPGQANNSVPKQFYSAGYDRIKELLLKRSGPLLDFPKLENDSYLKIEDPQENAILLLGRATTSIAKFITALSETDTISDYKKQAYKEMMITVEKDFKKMQERVVIIFDDVKKMEEAENNEDNHDRLKFYTLLSKVYLEEMSFLLKQHKKGETKERISQIAKTFREIGKENVSELPIVMQRLFDEGKNKSMSDKIKEKIGIFNKRQ